VVLFFATLFVSSIYCQERVDVVYLKNGDIVKGMLVENVPNNYVKIQIDGGSSLTIKYSDIEKFTVETKSRYAAKDVALPVDNAQDAVIQRKNNSAAQFKLQLGPVTGLNFNIGTGSDCPNTSTGFGFVIGGQLDMNFTPSAGLITNLQFYDNRSSSFSEDGSVNGIKYTVENSASIAYFIIEPLFKLTLQGSSLFFVVGPSVGLNIQATRERKLTSSTDNVTFQDGTTKQSASIKNMNARFEMKLGSGLDINLGSVILAPMLTFGYGITNIQQDISARILTIQALVAVKFNLL